MYQTCPKNLQELEKILRQNLESCSIDYAIDFGPEEARRIVEAVLERWKRGKEV